MHGAVCFYMGTQLDDAGREDRRPAVACMTFLNPLPLLALGRELEAKLSGYACSWYVRCTSRIVLGT
jgi:hypothetical protein